MELGAMIRPARVDEAEQLTALAIRSKAYWGYDAAFMECCRAELTIAAADIAAGFTCVLDDGDSVQGFYAVEQLSPERMELTFLFVEPARIGRGYGGALLRHAIDSAALLGAVTLEIQGDPNARRFYEAAGGRQVAERPSASIHGRQLPVFEIEVARLGA
jgi:GNAT superfamily N-acetyltransferase